MTVVRPPIGAVRPPGVTVRPPTLREVWVLAVRPRKIAVKPLGVARGTW